VPLLSLVLDLPATVALLSIPLIITNIPQAIDGDPFDVVIRKLGLLFIGLIVGVFVGISLLASVRMTLLKPVVGIVLIAVAMLMLFSPRVKVPRRLQPVASPAAGIVGGLAGGLAALP